MGKLLQRVVVWCGTQRVGQWVAGFEVPISKDTPFFAHRIRSKNNWRNTNLVKKSSRVKAHGKLRLLELSLCSMYWAIKHKSALRRESLDLRADWELYNHSTQRDCLMMTFIRLSIAWLWYLLLCNTSVVGGNHRPTNTFLTLMPSAPSVDRLKNWSNWKSKHL